MRLRAECDAASQEIDAVLDTIGRPDELARLTGRDSGASRRQGPGRGGSRDRRAEVLRIIGDRDCSTIEIASSLGMTAAGALKWVNRLLREGRILATQDQRAAPGCRYRRTPVRTPAVSHVLPDPYSEDWSTLAPGERLLRSWRLRGRLKDPQAAHDEKSLPKL